MEVIKQLLSNDYFVWCAMAVIIFCLTQILKLPIKAATKRIENERTRKIVNVLILIIPFGLGLLAEFLYGNLIMPMIGMQVIPFYGIAGLKYGSGAITLYGFAERFFKIKIDNPYKETEEGQAVQELIEDIVEDGKIDEQDISAVDRFWQSINKDDNSKK